MSLEYYWHIHHEVLCEALTEPLQNRIDYIKQFKPVEERELRLRLLTPVLHPERLPAKWGEAYQKRREAYQKWREAYTKCREADQKWGEAYTKCREADQKWREAYTKCLPEIEALHKEEHPDCPWNGRTIFKEQA